MPTKKLVKKIKAPIKRKKAATKKVAKPVPPKRKKGPVKKQAKKKEPSVEAQVEAFRTKITSMTASKRIANLQQWLITNKYQRLGEGVTRVTYVKGDSKTVIKVPKEPYNVAANMGEVKFAKKPLHGIKVAKCSLKMMMGVPVVEMERVEPLATPTWSNDRVINKLAQKYPWICWVDCNQVGKNSKGEVVAFDVGNYGWV